MTDRYVVKVVDKFTEDEVLTISYAVENFLNNCGYYIFSAETIKFKKSPSHDRQLFMVREAMKEVYNSLIKKYSFYNMGVRKIVMSGSFSTSNNGYYSAPYYHNKTALFMLANGIALAGEPTMGKYNPKYMLQMGEIDVLEKMESKVVDKKFSALFKTVVTNATEVRW